MLLQMTLFHSFMAEYYSILSISDIISSLSIRLLMDIQAFPCLGYCEWCCYEHKGACIFLTRICLDKCPGVGLLDHMVILFLAF